MNVPPVPPNLERAAGWSWRLLAVAAVALAVLGVLWYVRVIVLPIMIALTIAPALTPLAARLRSLHLERPAAALALLTGLAVAAGLIAIVTTSVLAQSDQLVDSVSQAVDDLTDRLEDEPFNLSLDRTEDLQSSLGDSWREASGYAASGVQAGIGLITGLVLAITILYFILRDGAAFWAWILRRFTPETRPAIDAAGRRAWEVLGGFVRGTAIIAAIDALLIGIGLWLLDVPLAFALAVLVFMGAFVPFVGAFVSGLVAVLVAFADGGWKLALAALAVVVAVQLLEGYFLQPIIQSRTVDLHPAVILLAVAAGASLFGVAGAYLGGARDRGRLRGRRVARIGLDGSGWRRPRPATLSLASPAVAPTLRPMAHPELPAEQAYVDHAYECLERMRAALLRTSDAGVSEVAAEAIEKWATGRLRTFEDAERGLCFGRLDLEGTSDALYVGRRWVHDERQDVLVVNWQAPAARPFYTATPLAPHGVTLRRRFRTAGRRLLGISDEALDGSLADAAAAVDDLLLEELERARDARMRDIVATIQGDQYRLIAREPEPPLVVQGGPGTGKTAVALHRASFLLYSHREALRRVLVVGPNPTFMDYVSHVLPTLGEDSVDQRAVAELVEGAEVTHSDGHDVRRLKADLRLAQVVGRAVELRSEGEPEALAVRLDGRLVGVREDEVAELLRAARAELGLTSAARERFRMAVLRRFYAQYGARLGSQAFRTADEVERALQRDGLMKGFLDRVWPAPRPEQVVRQLLASRPRLGEAADGILDADEQSLLRRARSGWSDDDLPLLDEARALLRAPPQRYGHVIVDESQDLTPMQLRMVGRRAGGAFTILGDIAQATGPIPYQRWDDVLRHLPGGDGAQIEELRHAYRVPREIMALALPLLRKIAPEVEPPVAYRVGADPPEIVHGDPPLPVAFEVAARLAGEEGLLAVIAPASLRGDTDGGSLFDETRIAVLTPREAKGMEFDHVIVVEPALIVEEAVEGQGLRELYVALTRPTQRLVVVHARPLPRELLDGRRR